MSDLPRRRLLDRLGSTPSLIAQHTRLTGDIDTEGALLVNGGVYGNGRRATCMRSAP
jgi:cytoskeletal protein CcmA (bactofilin family)